MQRQARAVADCIELPQGGDAPREHAVAALSVDVRLRVTGKRGDNLDVVPGEVIRQPIPAILFDNGQVAAVDDLRAARPRRLDQVGEEFAQLRRAAGDVDHGRAVPTYPVADAMGGGFIHHLRAPRRGVDMAMPAGLVATAPHVDLQGFESGAAQDHALLGAFLFKTVHRFMLIILESPYSLRASQVSDWAFHDSRIL